MTAKNDLILSLNTVEISWRRTKPKHFHKHIRIQTHTERERERDQERDQGTNDGMCILCKIVNAMICLCRTTITSIFAL